MNQRAICRKPRPSNPREATMTIKQPKSWRDVLATATPAMQNASKRAAVERMLRAHPDWSNRRIAASVHLLIVTDDDLDLEVGA
jgi:hypothetical protein